MDVDTFGGADLIETFSPISAVFVCIAFRGISIFFNAHAVFTCSARGAVPIVGALTGSWAFWIFITAQFLIKILSLTAIAPWNQRQTQGRLATVVVVAGGFHPITARIHTKLFPLIPLGGGHTAGKQ